jgi:hypothetical protein
MADKLENTVKVTALANDANVIVTSDDDIKAIENSILSMPRNASGSLGPFSWSATFHFNPSDIKNSYAALQLSVFGVSIINGRLDKNNPQITADLTVLGNGVNGEVGIDFDKRRVYFKGYVKIIIYKTDYDFTILNF